MVDWKYGVREMGWARMNDCGPKGLSKVTESKDLSESSWEDAGSGQEVGTWEIPCLSMTVLSIAAEMAISYLSCCCKHGGSFLVTNVFLSDHMNDSLLVASCITSHMALGQDAAPDEDAASCELTHEMCRSTLYRLGWAGLKYLPDHLPPPPSFSRQHWTLPFVCGPFGSGFSLLPALWREVIFSSPWVPSLPPCAWALLPVRRSSAGYQHRE